MFAVEKVKLWLRNKVRCQEGNNIIILGRTRIRACNISLKGHGCSLTLNSGVNLRDPLIFRDSNNSKCAGI